MVRSLLPSDMLGSVRHRSNDGLVPAKKLPKKSTSGSESISRNFGGALASRICPFYQSIRQTSDSLDALVATTVFCDRENYAIVTCKFRGLLGTGQCALTCSSLAEIVCSCVFQVVSPLQKTPFSCMISLRPIELNVFVFASC